MSEPDRYAVIGHPVAHSRSPFIHERFARQTGQSLTYTTIDATPADFVAAVGRFFAAGGRGLNVTLPHKEAAARLASELTARAARAGAVNTLACARRRQHPGRQHRWRGPGARPAEQPPRAGRRPPRAAARRRRRRARRARAAAGPEARGTRDRQPHARAGPGARRGVRRSRRRCTRAASTALAPAPATS